jgi:hypothetical protein
MIELHNDQLIFDFPELSAQLQKRALAWIDEFLAGATAEEKDRLPSSRTELYAGFRSCIPEVRCAVSFQRTLRIPDDSKDYPLPPGLGSFPLKHVDDFAGVPELWKERGGVMLPMHKTEAMWLRFYASYPMALKVGAGGICAISGERWCSTLRTAPQNYVVLPYQPWLDGFRVSEGVIRQFVAVPLGKGLTVEHQLTGEENWGGLQLQAFPLSADGYWASQQRHKLERCWQELTSPRRASYIVGTVRCMPASSDGGGFGAGGRMRQQIFADPYDLDAWNTSQTSRCFVHLCLADDWLRLTCTPPSHKPPTAQDYTQTNLPWFDYDSGEPAAIGTTALSGVESVNTLVNKKTGLELPDNSTVTPTNVVKLKSLQRTGDMPMPSSISAENTARLERLTGDPAIRARNKADKLVLVAFVLHTNDPVGFRKLDNLTWPDGQAILMASNRTQIERTNQSAQIREILRTPYFIDVGHDNAAMQRLVELMMRKLGYDLGVINHIKNLFQVAHRTRLDDLREALRSTQDASAKPHTNAPK